MHAEAINQGKHIRTPGWFTQVADYLGIFPKDLVCLLYLVPFIFIEMQTELQVISNQYLVVGFGNGQNLAVYIKLNMGAAAIRIAPVIAERRIECFLINFYSRSTVFHIHLHQSSLHDDSTVLSILHNGLDGEMKALQ